MSLKKRFRKDPGIPNEHPLKAQIIEEAKAIVAQNEAEKERLRQVSACACDCE